MSQDALFMLANSVALIAWICLILFHKRPEITKFIIGVPLLMLCVLYSVLAFNGLQLVNISDLKTLQGLETLMQMPGSALIGWVHYLAFDMLVGCFIANNAMKHGVKSLYILPCLIGTFILGPFGLLLYLVIRWWHTGNYWADNF